MAGLQPERTNERLFSRHRAWTENDDKVVVAWDGDVLVEDIDVVDELIALLPNTSPAIVLIQQVAKIDKFTPDARNKVIEKKDSQRLTLVVVVGASFHIRMVQLMVNRAMRLLHRSMAPMICCDTMEQARKHVDDHRRVMLAKSKKS